MKATTSKLRSPLKWHGGKSYLARRIIALMPTHDHYLGCSAGGLSVLLNKVAPGAEMVNDANPELINFWRCLRDDNDGHFRRALRATEYREDMFRGAGEISAAATPYDRAWAFMVRNRMSRGGLGKDFAWSDRLRGGQPGDVNAWQTILADLDAIRRRLQTVNIVGLDFREAIREADVQADTLVYADPPYLHETRTAKKAYDFEKGTVQHQRLLETPSRVQGVVMLSGYRSMMYDLMLDDWTRHEFSMPNHSGQGKSKQRRTECLWINR